MSTKKKAPQKNVAPFGSEFVAKVPKAKMKKALGGMASCTGPVGYYGTNGTGYSSTNPPEATDIVGTPTGYLDFF